jgi:DNA polymerase V
MVGVGIAPTKTLAKLANHAAKKYPATGSVVDLMDPDRQKRLLALLDVSNVWGVCRRTTAKLKARGIDTALDLANATPKAIRSEFSVVLERTIRELNGVSCLDLESVRPTKQQIICSRSFGHKVTDKRELREAIAKYTTRAAEKLRGEKRLCRVYSYQSIYSKRTAVLENLVSRTPQPNRRHARFIRSRRRVV